MLPGQKLLLAVSGGADSVAMLCAMSNIATRRRWRLKLVVGHVQHHLRDDAESDAQLTEQLANQHQLPFERIDLSIDTQAGNVEDMARQQRYAALIQMAKQHDCTAVLTAQHGLDQLETLLMRLLRGASLRGLGAMPWTRELAHGIALMRPALMTDHAMAIDLLNQINQTWCEDHTNTDTTRLRAALRQSVIPSLLELRPDLPQQIVNTTDQLQSLQHFLDIQCQQAVDHWLLVSKSSKHCQTYSRAKLKALHPAMLSLVLRQVLAQAGVRPDRLGAKQLAQFGKMLSDQDGSVRQLALGRRVRGSLDRHHLTLTPTSGANKPPATDLSEHKDEGQGIEDC